MTFVPKPENGYKMATSAVIATNSPYNLGPSIRASTKKDAAWDANRTVCPMERCPASRASLEFFSFRDIWLRLSQLSALLCVDATGTQPRLKQLEIFSADLVLVKGEAVSDSLSSVPTDVLPMVLIVREFIFTLAADLNYSAKYCA
jgi:hypothetical protein